jgi:hypothetical protein
VLLQPNQLQTYLERMHSAEIGDLIEEWAIQDQEAEANEKGKYPDKTSITSCLLSFKTDPI